MSRSDSLELAHSRRMGRNGALPEFSLGRIGVIYVIELLAAAAMMVKPALHLERFFGPGKLHPLKVRVALIEHRGEALPKVFVGPAHVGYVLGSLRELKYPD